MYTNFLVHKIRCGILWFSGKGSGKIKEEFSSSSVTQWLLEVNIKCHDISSLWNQADTMITHIHTGERENTLGNVSF